MFFLTSRDILATFLLLQRKNFSMLVRIVGVKATNKTESTKPCAQFPIPYVGIVAIGYVYMGVVLTSLALLSLKISMEWAGHNIVWFCVIPSHNPYTY